mgnify:CR=1 FL=1
MATEIDCGRLLCIKAAWQKDNKVEIRYRDVHSRTLTNDVQYFPPKERVY